MVTAAAVAAPPVVASAAVTPAAVATVAAAPAIAVASVKERILIQHMTSDRKLQASRMSNRLRGKRSGLRDESPVVGG